MSTAISKNDQLIKLAARHPNKAQITKDLELLLKEASETHDKYVIRARQYIESLTEPKVPAKLRAKRRVEVQRRIRWHQVKNA